MHKCSSSFHIGLIMSSNLISKVCPSEQDKSVHIYCLPIILGTKDTLVNKIDTIRILQWLTSIQRVVKENYKKCESIFQNTKPHLRSEEIFSLMVF